MTDEDEIDSPLIGKWRFVEMDGFDRDYIDLMGPGYIAFDKNGRGEFSFGCVTGALNCWHGEADVDFEWEGNDEMDEASGSGEAELDPDGTLSGTIEFDNGDESGFKARKWP